MSDEDEICLLTAEINAFAISNGWLPLNHSEDICNTWRRLRKPSLTTRVSPSSREAQLLPIWGQCATILNEILHHKNAYVFSRPVDPVRDGVPNYFEVVKKPMDLGTVRHRLALLSRRRNEPLKSFMYRCPLEMRADVDQVWKNCFLYHLPEYEVRKMGEELKSKFEARWKSMRIEDAVHRINKQFPPDDDFGNLQDHPTKEDEPQFFANVEKGQKKRKPSPAAFVEKEKKDQNHLHHHHHQHHQTHHHQLQQSRNLSSKEQDKKLKLKKDEDNSQVVSAETSFALRRSSDVNNKNNNNNKKKSLTNNNSRLEGVHRKQNKSKDWNHSRRDGDKGGTQTKNTNKTVEETKMRKLIQSCRRPVHKPSSQTEVLVSKREWLPPIERGGGAEVSKDKMQNKKTAQQSSSLNLTTIPKDKNRSKENIWKETLTLNEDLKKSLKGLSNKSEKEMSDFEVRRRLSMLLESVSMKALKLLINKVFIEDPSVAAGESNLDLLQIKYVRRAVRILESATKGKKGKSAEGTQSKPPSSPLKDDSTVTNTQMTKKRKKVEDEGTPLLATKTPRVSPPSPPWGRGLTHHRTIWENAVDSCGITSRLDGHGLGLTTRQESNGSTWEEAIPDDVEEGEIRN